MLREISTGLYLTLNHAGWSCWMATDPSGPLKLLTSREPGVPHSATESDIQPGLRYRDALQMAVKNLSLKQSVDLALDAPWIRQADQADALQESFQHMRGALSPKAQQAASITLHWDLASFHMERADPDARRKPWSFWLMDQEVEPDDRTTLRHYHERLSSLDDAFRIGEAVLPSQQRIAPAVVEF